MGKYIFTFLRRIKFNINYMFNSVIQIPTNTQRLKFTNPKYFETILDYLEQSDLVEENLSQVLNRYIVFGKKINQEEFSMDIFTGFDFKLTKNKFKPAYFNLADVKVPYEAGRLQGLQKNNLIAQEQALFPEEALEINNFPSIFWNSPMDVAIRNINLILHRNFNCDIHQQIINNSQDEVEASISQHYLYIKNNLEDVGKVVGNHYLIELTSLLFTIATFEFNNFQDDFEHYVKQLDQVLDNQFNHDGTSFEGSSHYAAFVTEALLICKLAIEEVDASSIVLKKIEKIIKANRLFLSTLIVDGELLQIGDNDSGRIFYFEFNEYKPLSMDWLINLIDYIYPNSTTRINYSNLPSRDTKETRFELTGYSKVAHAPMKVFSKDFELYSFKDFGIYVWRNDDEYLDIRCGQIGQNGIGGHSHYDQLAIECFAEGQWLARDPGTGTYTDDIELRNKFKSMQYHWGPKTKIKFPKEDEFDCFKLNYMSDGVVLDFDKYNFIGYAEFNGKKIYRKIKIKDGVAHIEDYSKDVELEEYTSWGENNEGVRAQFSEGYKRVT